MDRDNMQEKIAFNYPIRDPHFILPLVDKYEPSSTNWISILNWVLGIRNRIIYNMGQLEPYSIVCLDVSTDYYIERIEYKKDEEHWLYYIHYDVKERHVSKICIYSNARSYDFKCTEYRAEEVHEIAGRGTVYVIDMRHYPDRTILAGETIMINDQIGTVVGIETIGNNPRVGVILRKKV